MFAIIEHLKDSYGGPAEELEKSLLKVRSQVDRKMQIVDFATSRKPAAPLAARSNRPSTAPAAAKPAAPAQVEAFAPPASAAPAAPAAPAAAEAESANIQGPQRTPPRLPVAPRALLADAAALELVAAFVAGRDHFSMSGSEMHGLVHWLKSKGKSEVEDLLMVYKTLGEKKFQLCQYTRMMEVLAWLVPQLATPSRLGRLGPLYVLGRSAPAAQTPVAACGAVVSVCPSRPFCGFRRTGTSSRTTLRCSRSAAATLMTASPP